MTKYNIRIYRDGKTHPSVLEDVDRYLMEKGILLIVKWDEMCEVHQQYVKGELKPVVHAHWIEHPEYSIVCNCSNCGVSVRGTTGENYCFNCGAKMDEVIE